MQDYPNQDVLAIVTFMERQKSRQDRVEQERRGNNRGSGRGGRHYSGRYDRRSTNTYRPYPQNNSYNTGFQNYGQNYSNFRGGNNLLTIGVLRRCGPTECASPTFIIPKKDGRVRWISDLQELNKCLKRKVYPLPLIQDIINKRAGYKYFTKIDLTMMYYTLELDEESKEL
jgi:hypothetical protein